MGIRKDGNRLLCTLLLGNVAVNALLSIFLSGVTSGLIGFCVSTALIVVFGEILPQAICSRHALKIGELALPIVNVIMVVLAPVSVPLKTVLDKVLGDSVGTIHTKTEMIQYVKLQHERGPRRGVVHRSRRRRLHTRSAQATSTKMRGPSCKGPWI